MKDHIESSSLFKGTSPIIQNELISIITDEINYEIQKEIDMAQFISVQAVADDTTDVSCRSKFSIISWIF